MLSVKISHFIFLFYIHFDINLYLDNQKIVVNDSCRKMSLMISMEQTFCFMSIFKKNIPLSLLTKQRHELFAN